MPDFFGCQKDFLTDSAPPGGGAKWESIIFLNAPAGAVGEAFRLPQNSLLGRVGGT